jgi:hypothetical protein
VVNVSSHVPYLKFTKLLFFYSREASCIPSETETAA